MESQARDVDAGGERMMPTFQSLPAATPGEPARAGAYARLVGLASGWSVLVVAFAWAMAEASLFFVVPDVWLGLVALYAPRRMLVTLVAVILGAVTGGALLHLATPPLGDTLSRWIVALPGIGATDLDQARAELASQGIAAFLNGPLQGLPVKLYIHAAALDRFGLPDVTLAVALNRLERIGIFGLVMTLLGVVGRPLISRWPRAVLLAYVMAWVVFYAVFWGTTGS